MKGSATDQEGARRLRPATGLRLAQASEEASVQRRPARSPLPSKRELPARGPSSCTAGTLRQRCQHHPGCMASPATELHMSRQSWSQLTDVAATAAIVSSTEDLAAPGSAQAAADPRGTTWAAFGPPWKYSDVNSDAPNPRLGGTA